eukprot:15205327-Alexandrium_andersonii.AAC.1
MKIAAHRWQAAMIHRLSNGRKWHRTVFVDLLPRRTADAIFKTWAPFKIEGRYHGRLFASLGTQICELSLANRV